MRAIRFPSLRKNNIKWSETQVAQQGQPGEVSEPKREMAMNLGKLDSGPKPLDFYKDGHARVWRNRSRVAGLGRTTRVRK